MLRLGALVALVAVAGGLKRLDLEASQGETKGKYAFKGGEPEATCKACKAVMAHVERELAKPWANEFMGPSRREAKAKKSAMAKQLNDAAHVAAVLEPSSCVEAMKKCVRASASLSSSSPCLASHRLSPTSPPHPVHTPGAHTGTTSASSAARISSCTTRAMGRVRLRA